MSQSFFFYDLETSGINPREQRIMQFAGQRTNLDLSPIGEPINQLIALTDDVLPDPDAILVTGITPQKSISEGITEAEFLKLFNQEVAVNDTIFVGYNNVRFDDEFLRYLHYRNFYDPYEWHWQNGKSRWDLLDVVRMTRALRPEGIKWPYDENHQPTNKLELLTALNKLEHQNAHDALSDVNATIKLAQLIKEKQPRLFDYLLKMRSKTEAEELVKSGKPFVYSSGKYAGETEKTTIAFYLADNPKSGALVYDLRFSPKTWLGMTPQQLVEAWKWNVESDEPRLPIKTLQYNRCPAIAPLTVLDEESKQRLKIDLQIISKNQGILQANPKFIHSVKKALDIMNNQQQSKFLKNENSVDARLYDGFYNNTDKSKMRVVRAASSDTLQTLDLKFNDVRLNELLPLYMYRNFPGSVTNDDRAKWEKYRVYKFYTGGTDSKSSKYFKRLSELAAKTSLTKNQQYLMQELQLYAESILPEPN